MTPELKDIFYNAKPSVEIRDLLQFQGKKVHLNGLLGSALPVYLNSIVEKQQHHLFVLEDKEKAAYFLNDMQNLAPENKHILFFPHAYKTPYDEKLSDHADVVARAEVLERMQRGRQSKIVTYPEALFEKVVSRKNLSNHIFEVKTGEQYTMEDIRELLMDFEFENVDFVYEPGQFAIRGGIVDIFSYVNDYPFRIEFFDDEVETIRTFDPVTQLSKAIMDYLAIVPNVQKSVRMQSRETFFQFIPDRTNVWIENVNQLTEVLKNEYNRSKNVYNTLSEKNDALLTPAELYLHPDEALQQLIPFNVFEWGTQKYFPPQETINFQLKQQPSFNKNFDMLIDDIQAHHQKGVSTYIFSGQQKQIERLYKIFEDKEKEVLWTPQNIALKEGFIDVDLKMACYTDHQIFDRYYRFRLKESFRETQQALTLKELYGLQKGDFVTHVDHGVGRFSGLEIVDVNGKPQEAIRLIYKDNDVLYVSIHSLHRISKFTGKEGTQPTVNKIGSAAWSNLKKKTKKRVKEVAFDLIQLYAKRKSKPGFQFAPDTYLQNELEASFIYEDTPDQLKATNDVKKDMESSTPMDRLICGDVGFGKTEIAIRAAFKAVADNKQVAILVPTTILSLQHYKNFKERLKEFPCNVDYLNRFKSYGKVKKTLEELKEGKIDIVIGTHKLVGKNVKFKDLGLLIIDEEQKFGVSVKDKLKTFKESVDTLTLTATPIPRTLQFSLLGARDLSIINTPPPNRQPVMTEVIAFNEEKIQEAIQYEVSRGGQVFFVHNRVQNIHEVKAMIERLVPNVRVGIGHGQMDGKHLEQIMMDFVDGDFDVLLATTIVESGIDISNANTMIINEAQNFGLSDLHQLRGRVGRSNRKGFCYLIAPPIHLLPSDSKRRLEAITQFSDLGAGFNIAMRDLDIRGAGDMLGGEQSGFISDIGLEMYQKILNEAVQELKENEFKDLFEEENNNRTDFVEECVLETDLELRIPEDYVNQVNERLLLYRQLDNASNKEELQEYRDMMRDRFGPIPDAVEDLIKTMELRWMAKDIGFEKLILKQSKMIGYFIANQESPYYQSKKFNGVLEYIKTAPKEAKLSQKNDKLRLVFSPVKDTQKALEYIGGLQEVVLTT